MPRDRWSSMKHCNILSKTQLLNLPQTTSAKTFRKTFRNTFPKNLPQNLPQETFRMGKCRAEGPEPSRILPESFRKPSQENLPQKPSAKPSANPSALPSAKLSAKPFATEPSAKSSAKTFRNNHLLTRYNFSGTFCETFRKNLPHTGL